MIFVAYFVWPVPWLSFRVAVWMPAEPAVRQCETHLSQSSNLGGGNGGGIIRNAIGLRFDGCSSLLSDVVASHHSTTVPKIGRLDLGVQLGLDVPISNSGGFWV